MAEIFLTLAGISVRMGGITLLDDIDWTIRRGEQWVVTGPSGSGKTLLAHTLMGRHFYNGQINFFFTAATSGGAGNHPITMVEQLHRFAGRPGATGLYYQQRFNAADAGATITVEQELAQYAGAEPVLKSGRDQHWLDILHIRHLLKKPLIQLSNGENKRVQLAIALLEKPEMLILDNPFLGLDTEGRATLHAIINRLVSEDIQILLITGDREIPSSITHVAQLDRGRWTFRGPPTGFRMPGEAAGEFRLDPDILGSLRAVEEDFTIAVKMVNTSIRYGEAIILNNINWEVRRGERWSVSGPNGAGKSTILSLITADNPQAYANEIWLFDRRRGTGETIWEIKKKIGFISPELHLYFDSGAGCFEVVASGLFDTIGLFRPLTPEQEEATMLWMRLLSLQDLRGKRLAQLSTGEQRMVLLARALIKNPPMLILDEPCQGLDEGQTTHFLTLIAALCEAFNKTLVYVSHYREELPACIDRFLELDQGKIVTSTTS
jgi:molybdate transport system ATP-binding protein